MPFFCAYPLDRSGSHARSSDEGWGLSTPFDLLLLRKQMPQPDLAQFPIDFNQNDECRKQDQQAIEQGQGELRAAKVKNTRFYHPHV